MWLELINELLKAYSSVRHHEIRFVQMKPADYIGAGVII